MHCIFAAMIQFIVIDTVIGHTGKIYHSGHAAQGYTGQVSERMHLLLRMVHEIKRATLTWLVTGLINYIMLLCVLLEGIFCLTWLKLCIFQISVQQ